MPTVTLTNLQIDENPVNNIWGDNPNHVIVSADIIINTNETTEQQFSYEVLNSQGKRVAVSIFPKKVKPNKKENFRIGIDQRSKNIEFPDKYYLLNAWSVSTWTGRRFDWGVHSGIKEWERSSNIASISKYTNPPIVPPPVPVQIPNPLSEPLQEHHQQLIYAESTPEIIPSAYAEPEVLVTDPSRLHPNVKWMVLGVLGVGLLFAIIFLRRK